MQNNETCVQMKILSQNTISCVLYSYPTCVGLFYPVLLINFHLHCLKFLQCLRWQFKYVRTTWGRIYVGQGYRTQDDVLMYFLHLHTYHIILHIILFILLFCNFCLYYNAIHCSLKLETGLVSETSSEKPLKLFPLADSC